ncbi:MAG: hypothetical protein RLZZ562_3381 [Planctomycetota bacterium]
MTAAMGSDSRCGPRLQACSFRRVNIRPIATVLGATAALSAQTIDQVREAVREAASAGRYSLFVASVGSLVRDGEMSGGRLEIDTEPKLRVTDATLPYRKDFFRDGDDPWLRIEATLGYATVEARFPDLWSGSLPQIATSIDARYEAFVADVGVGPCFAVGSGIVVSPLVHLGCSRISNEAEFDGPGAAFTQSITEGILFDWAGIYGSFGSSLAVRAESEKWMGAEWSPQVRYDIRRTEGLDVDDPAIDADDTTQWITTRVDGKTPLGIDALGAPLHAMFGAGYRRWLGEAVGQLGFDDFYELTLGVGADDGEALPIVESVRFSCSYLFGDDVQGWSIGFGVTF